MLQVVEDRGTGPELGAGQKIETEMAKASGTEIIQIVVPTDGKSMHTVREKCGGDPVLWFQDKRASVNRPLAVSTVGAGGTITSPCVSLSGAKPVAPVLGF